MTKTAPPLHTIGYEGTTVAAVLEALGQANVALLIDVRAVAASRKPGFSKRQLAAALDGAGISYLHLQQLGTPKPGRDAVRAGHPERMVPIFRAHMRGDRPQAELAQAIELARGNRACLLCFERDHVRCHRALVAEMIAAETGQPVRHLAVAAHDEHAPLVGARRRGRRDLMRTTPPRNPSHKASNVSVRFPR